jgi:hypothetical protein
MASIERRLLAGPTGGGLPPPASIESATSSEQ